MPVVLRQAGHRFFFYSDEGAEPPHIPVAAGSKAAKFWLDPVELADAWALRSHEINTIRAMVVEHRDVLLEAWHEHLGR